MKTFKNTGGCGSRASLGILGVCANGYMLGLQSHQKLEAKWQLQKGVYEDLAFLWKKWPQKTFKKENLPKIQRKTTLRLPGCFLFASFHQLHRHLRRLLCRSGLWGVLGPAHREVLRAASGELWPRRRKGVGRGSKGMERVGRGAGCQKKNLEKT